MTSLLQYSLNVIALAVAGQRLGNDAVAAVSLAYSVGNCTGYVLWQGFAGALETLCSQAYGSGNHRLVGDYFHRMIALMTWMTIVVGVIWWNSEKLLLLVFRDPAMDGIIHLAATYLKVLLIGTPGWYTFECGKRYLQAQGVFHVSVYVLAVLAPLSAFLQWLLVFQLDLGFIGCPLAVALTQTLMALSLLFCIIVLGWGKQCWTPFSWRHVFAVNTWGPVLGLGFGGYAMLVFEWIAYEILTIWAGMLGPSYIAAQGTLMTISRVPEQVFVPIGIAASTRIANLIGADDIVRARSATKVAITIALVASILALTIMLISQDAIIAFFSLRDEAAFLAKQLIPAVALLTIFDALLTCIQGILRGLGFQRIGGWTCLLVMNGVSPVNECVSAVDANFPTGFLTFVLCDRLRSRLATLWFMDRAPGCNSIVSSRA